VTFVLTGYPFSPPPIVPPSLPCRQHCILSWLVLDSLVSDDWWSRVFYTCALPGLDFQLASPIPVELKLWTIPSCPQMVWHFNRESQWTSKYTYLVMCDDTYKIHYSACGRTFKHQWFVSILGHLDRLVWLICMRVWKCERDIAEIHGCATGSAWFISRNETRCRSSLLLLPLWKMFIWISQGEK